MEERKGRRKEGRKETESIVSIARERLVKQTWKGTIEMKTQKQE